jgi:hypothetical protein
MDDYLDWLILEFIKFIDEIFFTMKRRNFIRNTNMANYALFCQ